MRVDRSDLEQTLARVRAQTVDLCRPLEIEDHVVQPVEDASPPKWHLGHTTWFFEQVILARYEPDYRPHDDLYGYVFNSYYESFGTRVARPSRGTLSRPTVREVLRYRAAVDERMARLFQSVPEEDWPVVADLVVVGINHEQQHQELLVTDIKSIYACNPLRPVYRPSGPAARPTEGVASSTGRAGHVASVGFDGGVVEIGRKQEGFAWDNERPSHCVFLQPFRLHQRLVTNGEYLEFVNDGGYSEFRHWLSDGWDVVRQQGWESPLYWERADGGWRVATLGGVKDLDPDEPVCHVSFYEADAFARWAQKRLPTEEEWEHAAARSELDPTLGNFLEDERFHPRPQVPSGARSSRSLEQMLGDVWEWTESAYHPYPGYRPASGALGEYNGKFMNNQRVLRGGSCATPRSHIRLTYRNFFQPDKRWQFTGIRLAD
jgi:ergothioneine biosynthesis protein EgtB